ncbi:MAG: DUF4145 domain-containing protein, partial [Syntrophobacteraceae bacterium]
MGTLADREFNLEGWGSDKRLIEGPCGHCHHAVAFKEPEQNPSLAFKQLIRGEDENDEERTHYFIMGICPRPRCQQATIIYRQESTFIYRGNWQEPKILQERVIFPATSHRVDLPEEVPNSLREMYREAASIENLSPNGSAFLARRILEQTLRERFGKPKSKLVNLMDEFLQLESPPASLHQMMHDIREFGNIAGHPAQDQQGEWTTVDPAEASYTLDVVAEVLD